ncbi:hypothetical protein SETIT_1G296700v2 [Setaria italica]|uniref:Uncharacterized protein n=1 Tax=Setaria italica TaxID=4555 RepID=A0A368PRL4_SETIT|nr:hypothetical protein SETIT_1G296700v2 [Setaria italica]
MCRRRPGRRVHSTLLHKSKVPLDRTTPGQRPRTARGRAAPRRPPSARRMRRTDGHPSRSRRVPNDSALERAGGRGRPRRGQTGRRGAIGRPTMSREAPSGEASARPHAAAARRQRAAAGHHLGRVAKVAQLFAERALCRPRPVSGLNRGEEGWMDCCELVDKVIQDKKSIANEWSPVVVPCHSIPHVRDSGSRYVLVFYTRP